MKKRISVSLLFLSMFYFGSFAQCLPGVIGAWRCVSSTHGGVKAPMDKIYFVKYISKSSFCWISSNKGTNIIRSAMGGTCSFDGKTYIENIKYIGPGMTRFLGKKHVLKVELTKNKLRMFGTISDKVYIDEVWVRIDPE